MPQLLQALRLPLHVAQKRSNTRIHRSEAANWCLRKFVRFGAGRQERWYSFQGFKFFAVSTDVGIVPRLRDGTFEVQEIAVVRRLLRSGDGFVDIGANIGIYSVIASKLVGEKGMVFSFEPESANLAYLQANIQENGCKNITVIPKAVGAQCEFRNLQVLPGELGAHSMFGHGVAKVSTEVVSLDSYFTTAPKPIRLIKMDIEGFEPFALRGMARVLNVMKPCLLIEFNPSALRNGGTHPKEFLEQLTARFAVYSIDAKGCRRVEGQGVKKIVENGASLLLDPPWTGEIIALD